jgi:alkylresorcinol/alkylpyrone synthase
MQLPGSMLQHEILERPTCTPAPTEQVGHASQIFDGELRQGASTRSKLVGLRTALPKQWYSQTEIMAALNYHGNPTAEKIFERSSIDGRYLAVGPEELRRTHDPHFQHRVISERPLEMAIHAANELFEQTGVPRDRIGCLIVHTTSGFQMPSIATKLIAGLGLGSETERYDLVGAGCFGSVPVLRLADLYLSMQPDRYVLAITAEVGSHYMGDSDPEDREAMIINSLFGDAVVACLLGRDEAIAGMPEFVDFYCHQGEGSLDIVGARTLPEGPLRARIGRELPGHAETLILPCLDRFLSRHDLAREDITHWVFHPGGRAILDALQDGLGLDSAQIMGSRETLRRYGNAASSTALLVLEWTMRHRSPKPGELGLLAVIGPGLTVGFALLSWR